jgi:hypothetical protein
MSSSTSFSESSQTTQATAVTSGHTSFKDSYIRYVFEILRNAHQNSRSCLYSHTSSMSLKACRAFRLEGSVFICEVLLANNTWKQVSIDLDLYIGVVNGQLTWDKKGFSKHVKSFRLSSEGYILIAEIEWTDSITGVRSTRTIQLDLSVKIQNRNGVLVFVAFDENLSTMLSEVPWMKFRVIAEPDFSILTTHPVMRSTMSSIAQSTVHHVMVEMSRKLSTAIEEAMTTVMTSAEQHIASAMETMLVGVSGSAHIERSCSQLSYLETLPAAVEYGRFGLQGGAKSMDVMINGNGSLSTGTITGGVTGTGTGGLNATGGGGSLSVSGGSGGLVQGGGYNVSGGANFNGNTAAAASKNNLQSSMSTSSESRSESHSQSHSSSASRSQSFAQSGFMSSAEGINRVTSPDVAVPVPRPL